MNVAKIMIPSLLLVSGIVANNSFAVDNVAPVVTLSPNLTANLGEALTITAQLKDDLLPARGGFRVSGVLSAGLASQIWA